MATQRWFRLGGALLLFLSAMPLRGGPAVQGAQAGFADSAFQKVWERSDKPVADGRAGARSWMWGPQPNEALTEPYSRNILGGSRQVQYFDKARMEINDPNANRNDLYFVTNGRLVVEMVSGRVQIGDDSYDNRLAAEIPIAGDSTAANKDAPTYATLYKVANIGGAGADGTRVNLGPLPGRSLDRSGKISAINLTDVACPPRTPSVTTPVSAAYWEPTTRHNIPKVFWDFLNQSGPIYVNGAYQNGPVVDWVFAMGYPITEPYWIKIVIGTRAQWVLAQAFERRILTYNPCNEAAFQVEMGNVGLHYHDWRYASSSNRDAQVLAATGLAEVCPQMQGGACPFVPAVPSQSRVKPGGQARTGAAGSMDLQTRTTLIQLLGSAFVQFRDITDPITQIVVEAGRLFATHDPNGRDQIIVETGAAAVVALDTRFSVNATAQEIYINVRDGKGVAVTLYNQSLVLVPGQQVRFPRAAAGLPPPEPLDPDERDLWDQTLDHWNKVPGTLAASRPAPVVLPSAPVQTSPAPQDALGCNFSLTWDPVSYLEPVAYTVETVRFNTSTDTFEPWQRVEKITTTSYAVPTLGAGPFQGRWRVWAATGGVVGAASAWRDLNGLCVP